MSTYEITPYTLDNLTRYKVVLISPNGLEIDLGMRDTFDEALSALTLAKEAMNNGR